MSATEIEQRDRINRKVSDIECGLELYVKNKTSFSCRISIMVQNHTAHFLKCQERIDSVKNQPLEFPVIGLPEVLDKFCQNVFEELSRTGFFSASIEIAFDGNKITSDPIVIERSFSLSA